MYSSRTGLATPAGGTFREGDGCVIVRVSGLRRERKGNMADERSATERILHVLRPYASNWSGTLGRGDLVIPQREIPRLIREILDSVREAGDRRGEASDMDVFQTLNEARRLPSLQDQVKRLRAAFLILKR